MRKGEKAGVPDMCNLPKTKMTPRLQSHPLSFTHSCMTNVKRQKVDLYLRRKKLFREKVFPFNPYSIN